MPTCGPAQKLIAAALRETRPADQVALVAFANQAETLVSFESWTESPPAARAMARAHSIRCRQPGKPPNWPGHRQGMRIDHRGRRVGRSRRCRRSADHTHYRPAARATWKRCRPIAGPMALRWRFVRLRRPGRRMPACNWLARRRKRRRRGPMRSCESWSTTSRNQPSTDSRCNGRPQPVIWQSSNRRVPMSRRARAVLCVCPARPCAGGRSVGVTRR